VVEDGQHQLFQGLRRRIGLTNPIYVFRPKRTNRVKLLWWDGAGICLLTKRLENGEFRWPAIADGMMQLTPAQLTTLLAGLEWRRTQPREIVRPSATQ
jgi:transposase